ncbi:MAG: succinate dehydrogenase, cytochrome b556 subunit [Planctomycetota bacterium]|nr:succinate dehydrogenase, cytochrome b556 subunit [Planctomycetota bacterium]
MLKKILSIKDEVLHNRNEGTFAFILHRLTGLCLTSYIFLHLVVVGSDFIFGRGAFGMLMGSFEKPLFKILETCLICVIAFHMINGLRIIIADFLSITRAQRFMFWVVIILCLLVFILTSLVLVLKIL